MIYLLTRLLIWLFSPRSEPSGVDAGMAAHRRSASSSGPSLLWPILTSLLALLGLLFTCCGCIGFFHTPESSPTSFKVVDLETRSSPPEQQWLELKEGHLVWAAGKSIVTKKEDRKGKVSEEKGKTVYVPLVSKALFDDWVAKGGDYGSFPIGKVRVYVRMSDEEFGKHFSEADLNTPDRGLGKMKTAGDHTGTVKRLSSEESVVSEGLAKLASGATDKQILVLREGASPPTKSDSIGAGICLGIVGVLMCVPVIVVLILRRRGRGPAAAGAVDVEPASEDRPRDRRDRLADAASAGFEQGVRGAMQDAVEDAMRKRLEAKRQEQRQARQEVEAPRPEPRRPAPPPMPAPAPPPPPIQQAPAHFYYLRSGQRFGPVSLTVLRNLYRAGELQPNDLIWYEGAKDWMPASSSPYLRG